MKCFLTSFLKDTLQPPAHAQVCLYVYVSHLFNLLNALFERIQIYYFMFLVLCFYVAVFMFCVMFCQFYIASEEAFQFFS